MTVSADPRIGRELLGYRIEALLGRGGMSVVYRAEDVRLKRKVALKLLAPQLAEDERFRERFLRESELAASIDHPHVIPIYEAGEADGLLFIAMRYVEGSDLKRLLETEQTLEPKRALALLAQVADALDAAHQRGLVHRDVKPANILIADGEQVYLADFGLTKQASAEHGLTESNQFVGTGDYMAPEQIERQPIDARTDVYALACVLYECLTGSVPYPADRLMATLWAHVNDPPPALPAYPALDPVVGTALAKTPDQRYPSCGALIEAARDALGEPKPPAPRRGRRLLVAAALALAVAAAVPAVLLSRGHGRKATTLITADSLQRIDPRTNTLAATIRTGDNPSAVAVGLGSVWVFEAGDRRTLVQIDPHANGVARAISVAKVNPPDLMAVGEGRVWLADATPGIPGSGLWEYEPRSRSFARAPFPGFPVGVSAGAGAVWVFDYGHQPDGLFRARPETGRSLGYVAGCPCNAPVFGEGAAWTIGTISIEAAPVRLFRLDLKTARIVARVKLSFLPLGSDIGSTVGTAAGEGGVWLVDVGSDSVTRVDPATNRVTGSFPTGRDPVGIAVGEGAVWVANGRDGTVTRYDPRTADITTIRVGGTPVAIAVGEGGVWVATLTR